MKLSTGPRKGSWPDTPAHRPGARDTRQIWQGDAAARRGGGIGHRLWVRWSRRIRLSPPRTRNSTTVGGARKLVGLRRHEHPRLERKGRARPELRQDSARLGAALSRE